MIDLPIVTEHLTIRRFEPSDLDAYLQFMCDDDSTRFLAFDSEQKTETGARALFDYVIEHYDSPDAVHAYAVVDTDTDRYVGSCGYAPYQEGIVECYFCTNPGHRGRGIATEATAALTRALSPHVEVRAYCHGDNQAAHAVAQKCGMVHTGHGKHVNSGLEGELFVYPRQPRITIQHEVAYADPPEHVWIAITDPHALAEWFEPNDHNAVVGHRFHFMVDGATKQCEVLEAERPRRLTWSWQYVPGPDGKPRQSGPMEICWILVPDDAGTKLVLAHRYAERIGWLHRTLMQFGWKYMMKKSIPRILDHVDNGRFSPGAIPPEKRLYKCKTVPEQYVR